MMKRRAILHIGTEKAGSTSIQDVMARNRALLMSHGFAYPRTPGEKNHLRLALYAGDSRFTKGLARKEARKAGTGDIHASLPAQLDAELAALPDSVHTVIFSNEHCHSRLVDTASIGRLHELMRRWFDSVTVIVYLRRQDDLAVSRYSTALRTGSTSQAIFPDHLEGKALLYFDYAAMLDRWAAVFGRDAVRPRLFARQHLVGGDLIQDWSVACGLNGVPLAQGDVVRNPSLTPAAQEFLRRFNAAFNPDPNARRPAWVSAFLGTHFAGSGRLPPRAEAEAFLANFTAGNERVRREYFPHLASLFDPDMSRYPDMAASGVDDAAVLDVALALLLHLAGPAGKAARSGSTVAPGTVPDAEALADQAARQTAAPSGQRRESGGDAGARRAGWAQALDANPADLVSLRSLVRHARTDAERSEARHYIERATAAAPGKRILVQLRQQLEAGAAGDPARPHQ